MATGISLHIGLDSVDPDAYDGWDGALFACENDATALEQMSSDLGYTTHILLTAAATADGVFDGISDAAASLAAGDIFLLTYAGHGGQFDDIGGDEPDRKDETWVLYDREVLDDEIYQALAAFAEGIRVVVLSDSCHSGTVTRNIYEKAITVPSLRRGYERVAPNLSSRAKLRGDREIKLRGAPAEIQQKVLEKYRVFYKKVRASTPTRDAIDISASVLLISGCQDNQESAENNGHGAFTAALLDEWNNGDYTGNYHDLHSAIVSDLPPTQTPNYFTAGAYWPDFENQVPFTIEPPTEPKPSEVQPEEHVDTSAPWVEGPSQSICWTDPSPSFTVHTGAYRYYIFQITSDPDLFDADREEERAEQTWYSSWDDPNAPIRHEGELYWLPDDAWQHLRGNSELWFRVGTTPTEDSWDGYTVSTADDQGWNAPSMTIISTSERQTRSAFAVERP